MLFDVRDNNRDNLQEEAKVSQIDERGHVIYDVDNDFQFDLGTDECLHIGNSLEKNFKKVDHEQIHRQKVRDFIINHQNMSAFRE